MYLTTTYHLLPICYWAGLRPEDPFAFRPELWLESDFIPEAVMGNWKSNCNQLGNWLLGELIVIVINYIAKIC